MYIILLGTLFNTCTRCTQVSSLPRHHQPCFFPTHKPHAYEMRALFSLFFCGSTLPPSCDSVALLPSSGSVFCGVRVPCLCVCASARVNIGLPPCADEYTCECLATVEKTTRRVREEKSSCCARRECFMEKGQRGVCASLRDRPSYPPTYLHARAHTHFLVAL